MQQRSLTNVCRKMMCGILQVAAVEVSEMSGQADDVIISDTLISCFTS